MSEEMPSEPRVDRVAGGKFAKGNRLGQGNPLAGRAAKIRAVLLKKFTPSQAGEICDVLITMAKGGDIAAIRELFDRTAGKPSQSELLERIEKLERRAAEAAEEETI
jgi:hypothetical protein